MCAPDAHDNQQDLALPHALYYPALPRALLLCLALCPALCPPSCPALQYCCWHDLRSSELHTPMIYSDLCRGLLYTPTLSEVQCRLGDRHLYSGNSVVLGHSPGAAAGEVPSATSSKSPPLFQEAHAGWILMLLVSCSLRPPCCCLQSQASSCFQARHERPLPHCRHDHLAGPDSFPSVFVILVF